MIEVSAWDLILFATACFGSLMTAGYVIGRIVVRQFNESLDKRFELLEQARQNSTEHWNSEFQSIKSVVLDCVPRQNKIEHDFAEFKYSLPENYVRKKEFDEHKKHVEKKLDHIESMLERRAEQ